MKDIVEELMVECGSRWGDEEPHRLERRAADEIKRLRHVEQAAKLVFDKFKTDKAQGFKTRDKDFAMDILGQAL